MGPRNTEVAHDEAKSWLDSGDRARDGDDGPGSRVGFRPCIDGLPHLFGRFRVGRGRLAESGILAETTRIWQPLGVAVGVPEDFENACDRRILVKSDREAGPEDMSRGTAIAWVPFTAGRARRVVFVRMGHAVALVNAFKPGIRPPALTEMLLTKLVGRSLAHELGHVLLNSLGHDRSWSDACPVRRA